MAIWSNLSCNMTLHHHDGSPASEPREWLDEQRRLILHFVADLREFEGDGLDPNEAAVAFAECFSQVLRELVDDTYNKHITHHVDLETLETKFSLFEDRLVPHLEIFRNILIFRRNGESISFQDDVFLCAWKESVKISLEEKGNETEGYVVILTVQFPFLGIEPESVEFPISAMHDGE